MWHASAASVTLDFGELERQTRRMLQGVGDAALGQWIQRTQRGGMRILHLRRRVSVAEEKRTGPALDIRGTPEMYRRLNVVSLHSGAPLADLVSMETRRALPPDLQGIVAVD